MFSWSMKASRIGRQGQLVRESMLAIGTEHCLEGSMLIILVGRE